MKRAWMPAGVAGVGLAWVAGCDVSTLSTSWSRSPGRLTSDPLVDSTGHKATSRPAAQAGATPSDPLTQKVQSYVAQFPPADGEREVNGKHVTSRPVTASPASPPPTVVSKPPAAPPTLIYRSPDVREGTGFASAMAPAQVRPPEPRVEKAASPASPMIAEAHAPATESSKAPRVELLNVRAAEAPAVSTQPAMSGANQPLVAAAQTPTQSLNALITQLEGSIKLHPQQVEEQFKLRLLYAATGQEERATGAIEGVDPVQGEMMSAVLRAVVTARKSMQDPAGAATAVTAAEELRRLIAQQSPVMVPRVAMVTRVNSFGDYVAVNPPKFPAGDPVHVFLYTEVKNFRSETTTDNHLRTVLGEKVEIFDSTGKVIWERAEPTIEDRAYSPRTDFFMTMEIELPPETPIGDYVLKVTVEDKLGATTDQQRFEFSIVTKEPILPK